MARLIRFLTNEEEAHIKKMWCAGISRYVISNLFGMTIGMLAGKLRALGMTGDYRPRELDQALINKLILEAALIEKSRPTRVEGFDGAARHSEVTGEPPPIRPPKTKPPKKAKPAAPQPLFPPRHMDLEALRLDTEIEALRSGAGAAVAALKNHHCRWPIGSPSSPDFRYCCEPATRDKPKYCEHHYKVSTGKLEVV